MGIRIDITELTKDEYLDLHPRNYSECMCEHDPFRPKPSREGEGSWWDHDVTSGRHLVRSIVVDGQVVGLVHCFDFDREEGSCEIGVGIFEKENHQRGIAGAALQILIDQLIEERNMKLLRAETNCKNVAAIRTFEKLQFRKVSSYDDDGIEWIVMERGIA